MKTDVSNAYCYTTFSSSITRRLIVTCSLFLVNMGMIMIFMIRYTIRRFSSTMQLTVALYCNEEGVMIFLFLTLDWRFQFVPMYIALVGYFSRAHTHTCSCIHGCEWNKINVFGEITFLPHCSVLFWSVLGHNRALGIVSRNRSKYKCDDIPLKCVWTLWINAFQWDVGELLLLTVWWTLPWTII